MVSPRVARAFSFALAAVSVALLLSVLVPVAAQPLVPISIGDSVQGTLSATEPSRRYAFQLEEPQQVVVRIFATGDSLIPTLRLLGPTGTLLATAPNPAGDDQVEVEAAVGRGIHQIIVEGANGSTGGYLLLLESDSPAAPPQPLAEAQVVSASVDPTNTLRLYSFRATANEELNVFIDSDLPLTGPVATLKDAATGETLGMATARLTGVRFTIPGGQAEYLLEIAASGTGGANEPYKVCIARLSAAGACSQLQPQVVTIPTRTPPPIVISTQPPLPTQPPTAVPTATLAPLPPSAVCIAGSLTGNIVNVRAEPSTSTPIVTTISGLTVANVIGRLADGSWYQVSANGQTGWMSAQVVRLGGPCQSVPVVSLTPIPTIFVIPSNTPINTTQLNPNGPATYGTVSLVGGFTPDPHEAIVTSGGAVNVSYLGNNCVGFAAVNPDYVVSYTSGLSQLLRFYFISTADTTMIVQRPNGTFACNDDSHSTGNPTVDIDFPTTGVYRIWVANYVQNVGASGTLSVTEVAGNHP